jgi:hypothetical protein
MSFVPEMFPSFTPAPPPINGQHLLLSAAIAGAVAASRDVQKRDRCRDSEFTGYRFVPLTAETHSRLGKPFMMRISDLGDLAFGRGEGVFTKGQIISGARRDQRCSVPLQRPLGAGLLGPVGTALEDPTHRRCGGLGVVVRYSTVCDVQSFVQCRDLVTLLDIVA